MATMSLSAQPELKRAQGVIDDKHLELMTLGDRSLEREVLEIFARQTVLMVRRMAAADPARAAAAAHTLKGSARGVGAWRVARAAERLEMAAADRAGDEALNAAIADLAAAGREVRAAIEARLGTAWDEGTADVGRGEVAG